MPDIPMLYDNSWHHVVFYLYRNLYFKVYVDNVLFTSLKCACNSCPCRGCLVRFGSRV